MSVTMIRWKLREVMARYRITGVALADEMEMRPASITNLRNAETMPRLDGEKVNILCKSLSKLAGQRIRFVDLFEEDDEEDPQPTTTEED